MDIQNEIINAISVIVDKRIEDSNVGQDISTVITDIDGDRCKVYVGGKSYWVINGLGLGLSVGQGIWIRNPGDMSKAFVISAKTGQADKGYITKTDAETLVEEDVSSAISSLNTVKVSTDTSYEAID